MKPSPRSSNIAGLLSRYRLSISREALGFLEERDAAWRRENDGLRSDCHSLKNEKHALVRSMQDELDWFRNQNWALKKKVTDLADVEEANVRLGLTIDRLESEKNEEIDRVLKEKATRISELLRWNKVLQKKKVEVEVRKLKSATKVNEFRRVSQHRLATVEAEKAVLCKRIGVLEKKKMAETEARLEEEVKDKIPRLAQTIQVLKKEIGEKEVELQKMKSERNTAIKRMKERTSQLVQKNDVLEAEFQKSISEKSAENERILNEKIALEDLKIRMEADLKKEMGELVDRIKVLEEVNSKLADKVGVLERDKGALESEVSKKEMERNCVTLRMQKVKKTLEDEKRILEEEKDEKISKLEAEVSKKEMERNCVTLRMQKVKKTLEDEKRRLEEEKDEKISELEKKTVVLEGEKAEMEAEVHKANIDKSHESDRIVEVNKALEAEKVRAEEAEKRLSESLKAIRVLERAKEASKANFLKVEGEKSKEIDSISNEKRRLEEVKNKKISELVKRNVALEGEIAGMEDEVHKANKDKSRESDRLDEVKKALEAQMRRAEVAEKRVSENLKVIGVLKRAKEASEAKVLEVDREKSEEIVRILTEKMTLQDEKRRLEEEKNKKMLEHVKMKEVLEREKAKLEAEGRKAKNGKSNESDRIVMLKKALGDQKRRADAADKQVSEFLETISVLEREKEALEAEILKVDKEKRNKIERILNEKKTMEDEVTKRVEVLEREKKEMEIKFCQAEKEKSEEIERILNEKKTVEDEGMKRIEVLEREKKEMETKFCQVDKEKSEEIQRILNENTTMEAEKRAMKDDYEKKNLELLDRINILEREKRGLVAEIIEKDDGIKVFYQRLEDVKKELEMEINGSASKTKEDVQLFQSVDLADNIGMLSTPWQNEGKKSAGVAYSSEHGGIVNQDVENSDGKSEDGMSHTSACKRKRSIRKCEELGKKIQRSTGVVDDNPVLVPCEKNTEMNSTRRTNRSNGAETKAACKWKADQDLLDAFDDSRELCLKAVCALYRQHKRHKRLHHKTNASLSPGARVFKQGYFSKAKSLATFLIDEISVDNRMTKLVGKLDKIDVLAVGMCRNIAKAHYKQVFEIYKKKEDRLFLS